jgi:hypothetical protein
MAEYNPEVINGVVQHVGWDACPVNMGAINCECGEFLHEYSVELGMLKPKSSTVDCEYCENVYCGKCAETNIRWCELCGENNTHCLRCADDCDEKVDDVSVQQKINIDAIKKMKIAD